MDSIEEGLLNGENSGILGLGFRSIASTRATPFWELLANEGQLSSPEMGFFLNRLLDEGVVDEEGYGGEFTLGGTNGSLYQGEIEFLEFPSGTVPSFWLLEVTSECLVCGTRGRKNLTGRSQVLLSKAARWTYPLAMPRLPLSTLARR